MPNHQFCPFFVFDFRPLEEVRETLNHYINVGRSSATAVKAGKIIEEPFFVLGLCSWFWKLVCRNILRFPKFETFSHFPIPDATTD